MSCCVKGKNKRKGLIRLFVLSFLICVAFVISGTCVVFAAGISNENFNVQIGDNGEISSLKLVNDTYNTEYVMNAVNSPKQNTADHQWFGELMFTYRLGNGAWTKANTSNSASGRRQSTSGNAVTVTYENSSEANGIKNFQLVETYSLVEDHLLWQIKLKNTSNHTIEFGDVGLPLPFNERWPGGETIYETRVVTHSYVGNNSSYITAKRPSGVGPFIVLTPDADTGAGFEYMDNWRVEEHRGSMWAADQGDWPEGLTVFYIHSNVIKSTGRSYLPNTSLTLAPNQEKTYAFKIHKVANDDAAKELLYNDGLIDITAVPGMMFATDMTAKIDLHTSKTINSITAQYPSETTIKYLETVQKDHKIYEIKLKHLGQNNITVNYGNGEKTVLQFYAFEPIADALQRHSTFMVEKTQWNDSSKFYNKVFDDWMMDTKKKRGEFYGYWGWGDDWGYTHGQFLAEKNALTPVASEIQAVDDYLETAIWNSLMKHHQSDYYIHDFLMYKPGDVSGECKNPECGNNTPMGRGYAYPHIYNTYFSMYKIAKLYPDVINYKNSAKTYLYRAYRIMKTLYDGSVAYNWYTGLMGELTTPEIIQALKDEGYSAEANDLISKMSRKYNNFKNTKYPYGSEYTYDNTGEEAVFTLAKMNNNTTMMGKINDKTRACRGDQPVWYYYGVPVTICGEPWWQFQYTTALAGYCMDDWTRYNSQTPEKDTRMSYAAKIALIGTINSGQIDSDPANLGTVSWTYQAAKGNYGGLGHGGGQLHNGWRQMAGEADLGLFGAIKILSADVAIDPVFGLFGYGCDVSQTGSYYSVTPKDGIMKRLNMISQKLYMELEKDQYTLATISSANNFIELALKNLERASHTTKLTVSGLAGGSYDVLVDNNKVASVNVTNGQKAVFNVPVGSNQLYNVKINLQGNNTTPVVTTAPTTTPTTTPATGSIVYGDVNGDNQVNSIDFGMFRMYLLGMIDKMNAENWQKSGDVNLDGSINSIDFALLRSYMLGIVKSLPVGSVSPTPTPTGGSNSAPVVNAGNNANVTLPAAITLAGSASGGNGATLKTTWSLMSGPSKNNLDIINSDSLNTTALVTFPGTYVFKLSATDGVKTSSSTVTITVNQPVVANPPSWINSFYKKCIVVDGIPICATSAVPDQALINASYVMDAQLRKIKLTKPAVLQKMVERRVYTIIVGLNETNSMHPSWAGYNDSSWPRRGGGGNPTTILEEDCIVPSNDGWRKNFCGQVHEFAHTLLTFGIGDAGMSGAEPETYSAILKAYNNAIAANKYTESDYDRGNYHEYFTGQSGRWFDANPTNLNVPNAATKTDREQLKEYDPEMYKILESLYGDYELPEPWN